MVDLLWDHPWDHPPGAWDVIDVYVGFGTYIIVGRSPHCNIVIDHPSVSGRHLVITFSSNIRFRLLDMRSTNGTWFWTRHGRWKRVPRHGFAARWGGVCQTRPHAPHPARIASLWALGLSLCICILTATRRTICILSQSVGRGPGGHMSQTPDSN